MSRVYDKKEFSNAYDNITAGPFYNIAGDVGGYIYKTSAPFGTHIKNFLEVNAGGHYYAQSTYDCHTTASARIDLSKVTIDSKNRNGYIALSLVLGGGKAKQCDIGLGYLVGKNDGVRMWRPVTWSSGNLPTDGVPANGRPILDNQNGVIQIDVKISSTPEYDYIYATFSEVVASTTPGQEEKLIIIKKVGYQSEKGGFFQFHWHSKEPLVRFARFMSLVPPDKSLDDKDLSSMNATISDLTLDGTAWEDDRIEHAWSSQGANIKKLQISSLAGSMVAKNADHIEIYHRYQLT